MEIEDVTSFPSGCLSGRFPPIPRKRATVQKQHDKIRRTAFGLMERENVRRSSSLPSLSLWVSVCVYAYVAYVCACGRVCMVHLHYGAPRKKTAQKPACETVVTELIPLTAVL